MAKSTKSPDIRSASGDDTGKAIYGLAKALEGIGGELEPLYKIEQVADNLGELAVALHRLATATALSVIAEHGTEDDRATAVAALKSWMA